MKCHVCGERLEPTISDLPFRLGPTSIVVIKKLPVLECTNCTEFLLRVRSWRKLSIYLSKLMEPLSLKSSPMQPRKEPFNRTVR